MREWFAWCERNGLDPLVGVQRAHVELYIRSLGERGLMDSSVVSMLCSVRGFFKWIGVKWEETIAFVHDDNDVGSVSTRESELMARARALGLRLAEAPPLVPETARQP